MYVLTDLYDKNVICNAVYSDLEDAKADLDAEFYSFTADDNDIEYGTNCLQADDGMSAWARLDGKYRIWNITQVSE